MAEVEVRGLEASFEPVDWSTGHLPDDPDEIVAAVLDPARRGELYPLYRRLRELESVHRCPPELLHGVWLTTAFADTQRLLMSDQAVNDPRVVDAAFSHGDGAFHDIMAGAMLFLESASHQRIRNLVARAFTPRAIARWQPIAERVANRLCDKVEADEGMDLVRQFNYELPFNVIASILGVPEEDFPRVKQLAWDFARAGEELLSDDAVRRGDDAARGFTAYFTDLIEERRARPTDDLISALVQVEDDGDRLSRNELVCNLVLLMQAGHETTQDLLGNAFVALFRNPDQLALLRDDPDLDKGAVEEVLRYDGSVQMSHRLLLSDAEVGGTTIPAGSMVYPIRGAANRDPERFADPDRFDITRSPNQHVAFAFGVYYCLGASLARTAVGLRTLLDRFPDLRPARGTFEWRDTLLLRGPLRLDVTW